MVALPFALLEKARAAQPVRPTHIAGFALTGLALFSGNTLQQFGLLTTSVTDSGFLTGLYVVFTPILTVVLLRRQPHWVIWPAATLAAFGIFLLSGGALSALTFGETIPPMGYAGCAIIFAAMLAAELVPGLARTRSAGRPVEV